MKLKKELEKEINFIDEGIQACKEDSLLENIKRHELDYILGKSQALKIIKQRLINLITKYETAK